MKPSKLSLWVVSLGAVLLGLSLEAWGGGGSIDLASCQVIHRSGSVMKGTVALTLTNITAFTARVDATLRLRWRGRRGKEKIFRVRKGGISLGDSFQQVACDILAAGPVDADGNTIFAAFGIPSSKALKITASSINFADDFGDDGTTCLFPGCPNKLGLGHITFYVQ